MGLGILKEFVQSFILKSKYKTQNKFTFSSRLSGCVDLEGRNFLDKNSVLSNSSLGYASYIGHDTVLESTVVGRYTCIGPNVSVITGNHPTSDYVSMHPAFFSLKKQAGFTYVEKQSFCEEKYVDNEKMIYAKIGNDVWIGNGARIMAGVTVGDGAVIGSGALVTKDVEAYSIVGGVPAKIIRRRFEEDEIQFLMKLQWWNKGEAWIKEHVKYFDDIKKLMQVLAE